MTAPPIIIHQDIRPSSNLPPKAQRTAELPAEHLHHPLRAAPPPHPLATARFLFSAPRHLAGN